MVSPLLFSFNINPKRVPSEKKKQRRNKNKRRPVLAVNAGLGRPCADANVLENQSAL